MSYTAYEIRRTKETATGKWAICSWVGSTGSAMGNPECQGQYDYVLKKWNKIVERKSYDSCK